MYERFTDRARKVMQLADQEAQRLNHEYIGTEHILLGLIKEGSGVAAAAVKNLGVRPSQVYKAVEELAPKQPERVDTGKLPQTVATKAAIQHAMFRAKQLDHNYVGTEHLLLGLLCQTNTVAAHALEACGLTHDQVRQEVHRLLAEAGQETPQTTEGQGDPAPAITAGTTVGDPTAKILIKTFHAQAGVARMAAVKLAAMNHICRICLEPRKVQILLHYGREYACEKCLEGRERV